MNLKQAFEIYKFNINVLAKTAGTSFDLYEIEVSAGTRLKKLESCLSDIARDLKVKAIRLNQIDNKLFLEIAKNDRAIIKYQHLSLEKNHILIGQNSHNQIITADITKLPHLLIAGTTGSGKSIALHSIICSLIENNTSNELQMLLIDPKRIELSMYNGLSHLIANVVTDSNEAQAALEWAVLEMERRYRLLESNKNMKFAKLIIVIDELADLILEHRSTCEKSIIRLAQKARACGIHLIAATQRPSRDVITGLINANFPARLCFRTSSKIDSRVILETNEASDLLGNGDGVFKTITNKEHIQTFMLSENEIAAIVNTHKQSESLIEHYSHVEHNNYEKHYEKAVNVLKLKLNGLQVCGLIAAAYLTFSFLSAIF